MSPVKQTKQRSGRSLLIAVIGISIGIVALLAVFVFAIPSLTESGKVQVKLGADTFDAGPAAGRAATVAADGPILFSDVASRQRDIYLQHLGDDEAQGWSAFDARRAGTGRECTLRWDRAAATFADPCDGSTVPADGLGLVHYDVRVTDDGNVVVDLNSANRGPEGTAGG